MTSSSCGGSRSITHGWASDLPTEVMPTVDSMIDPIDEFRRLAGIVPSLPSPHPSTIATPRHHGEFHAPPLRQRQRSGCAGALGSSHTTSPQERCHIMTPIDQHHHHHHHHQLPTSASYVTSPPTLLNHRSPQCTISLFFCFLVPAVAVASVFFSVSWVSLHRAATNSVESVSNRLHQVTELHLRRTVEYFLQQMASVTQLAHASMPWDSELSMLEEYLPKALKASPEPYHLAFVREDGLMIGVQRGDSGSLVFDIRPADCNNSALCSNLTYWRLNDNGTRIEPPYQSTLYDPRTRPWYTAVVKKHAPTFNDPYPYSTGNGVGIAYGIPVLKPDGSLNGIVSVSFQFSSLTAALQSTSDALATSGILILMNLNGMPLACSSTTLPSLEDRKALMALPLPKSGSATNRVTFGSYGDSYILDISFVNNTALAAAGINWRLFLIIPKDDYFAVLDSQNRFEIGLIVGCIVCYSVLVALFFRILLTIPLRRLIHQLDQLKGLLQFHTSSIEMPAHISRFSELAALHKSVVEVIRTAEEAVEQRAKELAKAQQTEEENEQMQRLVRAKEMFFAMMSHEMRTPLTACIGMAEILLGTPLTTDQKECADAIVFSGGMMLTLVNNILDFSKLEADKLVLEKIPFSIRGVIERVVQAVGIKADEKRLELIADIAPDIPTESLGDPSRLSQVLLNLTSNAVKFTKSGYVLISCTCTDLGSVKFVVRDTGIGMSAHAVAQIFQPFAQADASISRQYGGTGLGLVISRRIIHMMGGQLEVSSEGEGRGSTFTFTLKFDPSFDHEPSEGGIGFARSVSPLSPLDATTRSSPMPAPPRFPSFNPFVPLITNNLIASPMTVTSKPDSMTILVVDSMAIRRHALVGLFHAAGVEVHQLASLDHLRELNHDDPIAAAQIIVLHLQEFTAEARSLLTQVRSMHHPYATKRRILFITNNKSTPAAPAASYSVSELLYLSKPVTLKKLQQVMNFIVGSSCNASAEKASSSVAAVGNSTDAGCPAVGAIKEHVTESCASSIGRHPLSPLVTDNEGTGLLSPSRGSLAPITAGLPSTSSTTRVLIVDDVVINQRVMTMKLQQRGFAHIDVASSGEAALRLIDEAAFIYDVVLMDVMMPEMDGYETTRRIKKLACYANVPVIGVTGNCSTESFAECVESGMVAVVGKPIDTERLFSLLQKHAGPNAIATRSNSVIAHSSTK